MPSSLRAHFGKQLAQLDEDVLQLGSLARTAVARALDALTSGDMDLSREVVAADASINRLRFDVEAECYGLLATEQPVARDLRTIVSALTVSNDLERIGDHGKKIAGTHLRMFQSPMSMSLCDLPRLGQMALTMLDRGLHAYATHDRAEADAVCKADDQVDALYKQTFNVILSYMLENPRLIGFGTYLLQIAHEIERVADLATNIAERVIYSATGELVDLNV